MAQVGDIVLERGERWVVAAFDGNAFGTQDAIIIRTATKSQADTRRQQMRKEAAFLNVVETPVFANGERVRIAGDKGTVQRTDDEHVYVLMDEREHPLTLDPTIKIAVVEGITRIAIWELVLETRGL